MGNKIVLIVALFAVMVAMTGIAAAAFETISAIYDGTNIITNVGNLAEEKYYLLIYYPPGTFPCNTGSNTESCDASIEQNQYASGHILGQEWCSGYNLGSNNHKCANLYNPIHTETFDASNAQGVWAIGLWHGGQGGTAIESFKVSTGVSIPIPEFPTVALPIAAVIGLVFFFQHRKKKEE